MIDLMGVHPEATYAALCATYAPRNPFRELAHGLITLNELRILVRGLPDDSAMHRELSDRQGWRTIDYLIAGLRDDVRYLTALTAAAHSEDGAVHPPEPIETPQSAHQRELEAEEQRQALAEAREWADAIEASLTE